MRWTYGHDTTWHLKGVKRSNAGRGVITIDYKNGVDQLKHKNAQTQEQVPPAQVDQVFGQAREEAGQGSSAGGQHGGSEKKGQGTSPHLERPAWATPTEPGTMEIVERWVWMAATRDHGAQESGAQQG